MSSHPRQSEQPPHGPQCLEKDGRSGPLSPKKIPVTQSKSGFGYAPKSRGSRRPLAGDLSSIAENVGRESPGTEWRPGIAHVRTVAFRVALVGRLTQWLSELTGSRARSMGEGTSLWKKY